MSERRKEDGFEDAVREGKRQSLRNQAVDMEGSEAVAFRRASLDKDGPAALRAMLLASTPGSTGASTPSTAGSTTAPRDGGVPEGGGGVEAEIIDVKYEKPLDKASRTSPAQFYVTEYRGSAVKMDQEKVEKFGKTFPANFRLKQQPIDSWHANSRYDKGGSIQVVYMAQPGRGCFNFVYTAEWMRGTMASTNPLAPPRPPRDINRRRVSC